MGGVGGQTGYVGVMQGCTVMGVRVIIRAGIKDGVLVQSLVDNAGSVTRRATAAGQRQREVHSLVAVGQSCVVFIPPTVAHL